MKYLIIIYMVHGITSLNAPTEAMTSAPVKDKKTCSAAQKVIENKSQYLKTVCVARW